MSHLLVKAHRVKDSCHSLAQLLVADKYLRLAANRMFRYKIDALYAGAFTASENAGQELHEIECLRIELGKEIWRQKQEKEDATN